MAQMIDALKATVEAEKTKLLAELSQATEPRLSAIRKKIEACQSLLGTRTLRRERGQAEAARRGQGLLQERQPDVARLVRGEAWCAGA